MPKVPVINSSYIGHFQKGDFLPHSQLSHQPEPPIRSQAVSERISSPADGGCNLPVRLPQN